MLKLLLEGDEMKEKIIHYKWIILVITIVILNLGWNLYTNKSFSQEVIIKENKEDEGINQVQSLSDTQVVDQSESEEEVVQSIASFGLETTASELTANALEEVDEVPTQVPIYICGEVMQPGVYYVEAHAIVNDVVEMSGGFTRDADSTAINLASPVQPNEKIIIPKQGEQIDKSEDSYENRERVETLPSSQSVSQSLAVVSNEIKSGLININTATKEQLMTLNGIGAVKAEAIIVYRQENSGFKSIDEIMQISGIGEKTFEKIKQFITT